MSKHHPVIKTEMWLKALEKAGKWTSCFLLLSPRLRTTFLLNNNIFFQFKQRKFKGNPHFRSLSEVFLMYNAHWYHWTNTHFFPHAHLNSFLFYLVIFFFSNFESLSIGVGTRMFFNYPAPSPIFRVCTNTTDVSSFVSI